MAMNFRKVWAALKERAAARAQLAALSEFSCAHCERFEKCGLPPSDDCVEKLEQIERGDDWRYRPAARSAGSGQLQY